MSGSRAWLEAWTSDDYRVVRANVALMYRDMASPLDRSEVVKTSAGFGDAERLRLAAAAPSMVRALLLAEFGDNGGRACSVCHAHHVHGCTTLGESPMHKSGCALDGALTAAGFPDQASREEARELLLRERPPR